MSIFTIINLVIVSYVIPAMITYLCIKWEFTYRYKFTRPGFTEMFFVLCPMLNVVFAIASLLSVSELKSEGYGKNGKKSRSLGEIFFRMGK